MKIIFSLLLFFTAFTLAQSGDCDYLRGPDGFLKLTPSSSQEEIDLQFNNAYAINVCEGFIPIDAEVDEYVQSIKKTEGKALVEVVHGIGNTLCREFFGECGEESFYGRYKKACNDARAKTLAEVPKNFVTTDTTLLLQSFATTCEQLATTKLQAYKEVAVEEAARYQTAIVENSNKTYLKKAHDMFNKLIEKFNTTLKMFGDIARSFEAFTGDVHV